VLCCVVVLWIGGISPAWWVRVLRTVIVAVHRSVFCAWWDALGDGEAFGWRVFGGCCCPLVQVLTDVCGSNLLRIFTGLCLACVLIDDCLR
jgi:hypothetical protein